MKIITKPDRSRACLNLVRNS